jgi:monoamine oxidase
VDNLAIAAGIENIRYGSDIRSLAQDSEGVTVTCVGSKDVEYSVRAKRVIIAMSPGATQYIAFSPDLSRERRGLVLGAPMAMTIKGFLRFDRAWWRPKYTGYVLSAAGPADWVLDNTWWDPADETWKYPALMTFIVGKKAREYTEKTEAERRADLLNQVYRLFEGNPTDNPCIDYRERDWLKDEWSHGCPAGCLQRNVLTQYGVALRRPEGRFHWAGSESATDWMGGYMNGALQAGIRAAGEVLELV